MHFLNHLDSLIIKYVFPDIMFDYLSDGQIEFLAKTVALLIGLAIWSAGLAVLHFLTTAISAWRRGTFPRDPETGQSWHEQ